MRSRKLGRGTAAALVAAMLAAGCAEGGDGELGTGSLDGDVTGISLSLTTVPTDAKCYRATFTSGSTSVVKTASPTAGSTTPVTFTGLTSSTTYALTLEVFDLACGSVVATTPIVWTGSASNVLVINGMLTPVTIVLRRPAGTAVTVDYDSSIVLSQGSGTSIYDIAVQEPNVYAARGAFVERVPVTGGGVEIVATGQSITEVAADATGYYYCDSYTPAFYWVADDPLEPGALLAHGGGRRAAHGVGLDQWERDGRALHHRRRLDDRRQRHLERQQGRERRHRRALDGLHVGGHLHDRQVDVRRGRRAGALQRALRLCPQ
jgi:hypothetical protein